MALGHVVPATGQLTAYLHAGQVCHHQLGSRPQTCCFISNSWVRSRSIRCQSRSVSSVGACPACSIAGASPSVTASLRSQARRFQPESHGACNQCGLSMHYCTMFSHGRSNNQSFLQDRSYHRPYMPITVQNLVTNRRLQC